MDFATIVGLFLAWGALGACLLIEGGHPGELANPSAFVLVVFGTVGATMTGFSLQQIAEIPGILRAALVSEPRNPSRTIRQIVDLARKARRDGILSLEDGARRVESKFLQKGLQLIIDGTPSELVREVLETEIAAMQERHKVGESIFTTMGGYSPTLGIIGTVIGLINMLARLNEPGKMGHAIAAAFIATLYGVAFANLLYLPIGNKLKSRTNEEILDYEMIAEGVLSIQAGDNPRIVEMKMLAFLPPSERIEYTSSQDLRIAA